MEIVTTCSTSSKKLDSYFGDLRITLSDNGGEVNNKLLCKVCEQFNITMKSKAAKGPWSNDIVEKRNEKYNSKK